MPIYHPDPNALLDLLQPNPALTIDCRLVDARVASENDNEIVFSYVLKENLTYWLHMHNYHYKNKTYINFLYYLLDFCCLYDSNKCKEMIDNILFDTMSKNQHKKNIVKIVKRKWMN